MPRSARLTHEGALYHLTSRGVNKRAIFRRARDRFHFLDFLAEETSRQGWLCYAYCLMRNHFHLLIETPLDTISRGMHRLLTRYAMYFNRAHQRTGHLFENRFYDILVERQSHLLEVSRYVVLNPVRAGICERPEQSPWSSYRATAGLATIPDFVRTDKVLELFHQNPRQAQALYAQFVHDGIGRTLWDELKEGRYLGSDDFVERIKAWESGRTQNMADLIA